MRFAPLISVFVYALSLAFPAFTFQVFDSNGRTVEPSDMQGLAVLLVGWLGLFYGQFGWFANPCYFLSLGFIAARRWRSAFISSAIALLFAANALTLFSQVLPADEGGVQKMRLLRFGIGFYFWLLSLLIPFFWSLVQSRKRSML